MARMFWISLAVIAAFALGIYFLRTTALVRPALQETSKFFYKPFEIIAHRGGALEAPENTMAAFDSAAQIDAEIPFELDVHLSKDDILMVIHDPTVERTTNGHGAVHHMTAAELKVLDAGYNFKNGKGEFNFRGKGVQIPTLEEVLSKFTNRRLLIEIKDEIPGVEYKIVDLIKKYKAHDRVILGSQKSTVIAQVKNLAPDWNYLASSDEVLRLVMLSSIFLEPLASMSSNALAIPERERNILIFSPRLRDEIHRRGKKILIWTVNQEHDMQRLIAQGVDGLITDRPSLLYKLTESQYP